MSDAETGGGSVVDPPADGALAPAPSSQPPDEAPPAPQTPAPESDQAQKERRPSIVARYGLMKQIGEFRHNLKELPAVGTTVVVRTERGVERGTVVVNVCDTEAFGCIKRQALDDFLKACGKDYPFRRQGKVLRLANHQDVVDYRHLSSSGCEEAAFCREQMRELELSMRLVTVEHLLGGGRIIFYFAAESRVDFRELVRGLASQYHTRIEMRQVGARDEARLVADYERCGQRCCCQRFLQYLKPVSMRMAKTQKATLDPSKISGRCGRLMCCLRFEDAGYETLRKNLPRRNTWVRTAELVGRVVDTQILTQLVRVALLDKSTRMVSVEEILERDVEAPTASPSPPPRRRGGRTADRQDKPAAAPAAPAEPSDVAQTTPSDDDPDGREPRKRRKRRRRKKGQPGDEPGPGPTAEAQPGESTVQPDQPQDDQGGRQDPPAPDGPDGDGPAGEAARPAPKRRRRRTRKKKKPSGQSGG